MRLVRSAALGIVPFATVSTYATSGCSMARLSRSRWPVTDADGKGNVASNPLPSRSCRAWWRASPSPPSAHETMEYTARDCTAFAMSFLPGTRRLFEERPPGPVWKAFRFVEFGAGISGFSGCCYSLMTQVRGSRPPSLPEFSPA